MSRLVLIALTALVLAPAASAQLTLDAHMVVTLGEQTVRTAPSGSTFIAVPSSGMLIDRADASLSGSVDCSGHAALAAGGALALSTSVCLITDASGDAYTVVVRQDVSDRDQNTWRLIDGTGRYAGATGEGQAQRLAATADGRGVYHVTGTLQDVGGTN